MSRFDVQARDYLILVEGGPPSNSSAWSPELLGCIAVGDTMAECVEQMLGAIAFHREAMDADGRSDPRGSRCPGVYVPYEA